MAWVRPNPLRVALVLLLLSACGKKAAPIPPERLVPRPVDVNLVRNVAEGIRLFWEAPKRTVNNKVIERLEGFAILRADGESRADCAAPGNPYERVGFVRAANFEPGGENDFTFLDRNIRPGRWYSYRVLAVDKDGNYGNPAPNQPIVRRGTPPLPAPFPQVVTGDGFLTFRMPEFPPGVFGWYLYRAPTAGTLPDLPLFPTAVTDREYTDGGLTNDVAFRYSVAWAGYDGGFPIEGQRTPWLIAAPHDLVPPQPPGSMVAVAIGDTVDLRWERVEEPGVRYHVYRRLESELSFNRITQEPVSANALVDAAPKGQFVYAVTAVDQADNESPRGPEARVRVR